MQAKCPKCKTDITNINSNICKCGNDVTNEKIIQLLIGDYNGKITSNGSEERESRQNTRSFEKKRQKNRKKAYTTK